MNDKSVTKIFAVLSLLKKFQLVNFCLILTVCCLTFYHVVIANLLDIAGNQIQRPAKQTTQILYYTQLSKAVVQQRWISDEKCKGVEPGSCLVHSNKDLVNESHAIVFTGGYNPTKNAKDLRNNVDKIFIFATLESASRIPKIKYPPYFFNATMSYSRYADIPFYYRKRWITQEQAIDEGLRFMPLQKQSPKVIQKRKHLMSAIITNCQTTPSGRTELVKFLERKKYLNLLGKCSAYENLRTVCPRKDEACVQKIFEDSYFFLALENTICLDYITEKYWDRATYDSVPIMWSRQMADKQGIPDRSVIYLSDFKNIDDFLRHLNSLVTNQTAYREYFDWRQHYMLIEEEERECLLCRHIQKFQPKMYRDAVQAFANDTQCQGNFAKKFLRV